MSFTLDGKVALVTGGGRGIGKAIARRFAEAGANVVIASRKVENLEAAAAECMGLPGRVVPIACHVGKVDQLENLVAETEKQLGPVDVLVNNSATNIGQGPALDVTDEALLKTMEINVLAAHRLIRMLVPKMASRGAGGSIINVASIAGLRPQPQGLVYSSTKAALIMMTRVWAIEFGAHRIRVNAICPGLIQTDFSEYFWKNEGHMERWKATQPLPFLGQPEEIAGMALYLASDESSYVTGTTMVVDGGATAR
jgi:NAD(P)-dependent dehydrogenase (short-subunit alcohol dehydrogenase family)